MDLISLVVVLIVVGVLLWMINSYIPMEARIKQILNIVVIIAVVLWLLNAIGILGVFPSALISLVVSLIVVGLLLWLVNSYIPMDARIKQITECRGDHRSDPLAAECIRDFGGFPRIETGRY